MKSFAWAEFLARLCGLKIRLVHPVNPFEMSYLFTKNNFIRGMEFSFGTIC